MYVICFVYNFLVIFIVKLAPTLITKQTQQNCFNDVFQ